MHVAGRFVRNSQIVQLESQPAQFLDVLRLTAPKQLPASTTRLDGSAPACFDPVRLPAFQDILARQALNSIDYNTILALRHQLLHWSGLGDTHTTLFCTAFFRHVSGSIYGP